MISYLDACSIAKKLRDEEWREFPYIHATELEDRWAFILSVFPPDSGEGMIQPPMFFIYKKDGSIEWFSIPPIENLDLLNSGKEIAFYYDN